MEKKDYVVAIDLGTSKVATLVGRKSDENKIEILGSWMYDSLSGVVRGEIKNTEHVSNALQQTIEGIEKDLRIHIREAWVGVSGQHIKTLKNSGYIFIENNDGEVLKRDVQRLNDSMNNIQIPIGETIVHILPQEYRLDDEPDVREPIGMIGNKLDASFNIIVGDKSAIGRIDRTLSRYGISVKRHILNPLAAAEAILHPDEKELGVCVVDIGGGTTDICIYHDNIIRHAAVIPLGGNIINKDIRTYGILERRVEALKVKFGGAVGAMERADKFICVPGVNPRDPKEISCRNLAAIIEARLLDIIDSVILEIKKAGYEGRLDAGIVLTGGTAQTRNIDELFKTHTGYDVRVALPDAYITSASLELVNSPAYSVAVGLLLKAIGGATTTAEHRPPLMKTGGVTAVKQPVVKKEPVVPDAPPRRVWNHAPDNDFPVDEEPQEDTPPEENTKKKNGWLERIKKRFSDTFTVVEDDEI